MEKEIKGFKATLPNCAPWYATGVHKVPYVVGWTYSEPGGLMLCAQGLHFCESMIHVYYAYLSTFVTRIFEVTATGNVISDDIKSCTDRLRIDRELPPKEILEELLKTTTTVAEDTLDTLLQSLSGALPADTQLKPYADCIDYDVPEMREWIADRRSQFIAAARQLAVTYPKLVMALDAYDIMDEEVADGK